MNHERKRKSTGYYVWLGILALILMVALAAWVYELQHGLGVTGMRDVISWGLYILTFAFFVKLSAGGLIVASSAEVFGISALKPLARLGVLTAVACILTAAMTLIPDLGRPDRVLNLFIYSNWTSPLIWDVTIVTLYLLLAVAELWLMSGADPSGKKQTYLKILAYIGLPAAFALHSITAWIFGLQISRAFWNTALMAPLFVVSAILSGTALVSIIVWAIERSTSVKIEESSWKKLSGLMAISLAIDLFFILSEYITILWGQVPREMVALKMILPGGQFAFLFWLEWVVGGILPFVLLVVPKWRHKTGVVAIASALILAGVYAFQIELMSVGMANPIIQLPPGTSVGTYTPGTSVFQLVGQYVPTWVEYAIILGLVAFAALFITLGYRLLEIKLDSKSNSPTADHKIEATLRGV